MVQLHYDLNQSNSFENSWTSNASLAFVDHTAGWASSHLGRCDEPIYILVCSSQRLFSSSPDAPSLRNNRTHDVHTSNEHSQHASCSCVSLQRSRKRKDKRVKWFHSMLHAPKKWKRGSSMVPSFLPRGTSFEVQESIRLVCPTSPATHMTPPTPHPRPHIHTLHHPHSLSCSIFLSRLFVKDVD